LKLAFLKSNSTVTLATKMLVFYKTSSRTLTALTRNS